MFHIENCKVVADSPNAILVESPELEKSIWVPQSQVCDESEVWKKGDEGTLIITDWIAEQKGLV